MILSRYNRESKCLDGTWELIPDPYESFDGQEIYKPKKEREYGRPLDFNLDNGYSVDIPASWGEVLNEFLYYEGWMWHTKKFSWDGEREGRVFLRLSGVNYKSQVWLNGEKLGSHEGGFTPFTFEVTESLEQGDNLLVVLVDNKRHEDYIPELRTDWYNFGGIHRSVELISVPESFIRNYKLETSLSEDQVKFSVRAWVDGFEEEKVLELKIPELGLEEELNSVGNSEFYSEFTLPRERVELWSTDNPKLYDVSLSYGEDSIDDRVGFREVEVEDGEILLNGESIWLRGISMHEEEVGKGRALDSTDVEKRFERLRELNCNFARLAHYPHTPEMAQKA
ncbi:beta-glucuronidase, partial [candidate division MSBL1 archaeon SCGC-AAA259A05]